MGPSIELKQVALKYGDNTILESIDHQFEAGKCHIVMGPNGGGKTSLLRSILGLTPFTGDINIQWPEKKGDWVMFLKKPCLKPACR
ncbi:Putative putative ATP-binding component of ABC transporter (fragment) [Vibrio tapetis subsp. tapetis]|uniref:Putative ATP-binding component of ABC transporter n=1 Tax=Vibrio tapetis subsp. tapetis TaxID=1671868 RepID=A0A2N8ZCX8_9VIBR